MDTRAINHVLANSSDYQMAPQVREILTQIIGEGGIFTLIVMHLLTQQCRRPCR